MRRKRVLIDLSILKNVHCGLGQIALNYGRYYQKFYSREDGFDLYLIVPESWVGKFGNKVKYVPLNWWNRHILLLIPHVDVWHALHQLSRLRPLGKTTKYILSIHDFNYMYEKTDLKQEKYKRRIERRINRADKVVCISNFTKSEALKYTGLKDSDIEVVYNGVEALDVKKAKTPAFVKRDIQFFFTIGQIREKKNFHVLVPLMRYFPDKMLYIAGQKGTKYAEYIESLIKKEKLTNVQLVGEISNEERIWLYDNCQAFLFPSLFEGFGLPIIEAMSFGKPVFSSKETSLKEIGADRAFFWDSFDPESMRNVINANLSTFLNSPTEKIKNKEYAASFSYDRHMGQYLKLYNDLLK